MFELKYVENNVKIVKKTISLFVENLVGEFVPPPPAPAILKERVSDFIAYCNRRLLCFFRKYVGQNRVRKKRKKRPFCKLISRAERKKAKKIYAFHLEIFPRPPRVHFVFGLLSVVISVKT